MASEMCAILEENASLKEPLSPEDPKLKRKTPPSPAKGEDEESPPRTRPAAENKGAKPRKGGKSEPKKGKPTARPIPMKPPHQGTPSIANKGQRKTGTPTNATEGVTVNRDNSLTTASPNNEVSLKGEARWSQLETRLCDLWEQSRDRAIATNSNASGWAMSYTCVERLFAAFGCRKGTVMEDWVKELGVLRVKAKTPSPTSHLSFPTDNFTVLCWMARNANWEVLISDGSRRPIKGKNTAGAAAINTDMMDKVFNMKVQGMVQTNTRAEYEAGWMAWLISKPNKHAFDLSDSEDFVKLADTPLEVFVRSLILLQQKNALPAVVAKMLQLICPYSREAIHIKAHCGCEEQDEVDRAAYEACEMRPGINGNHIIDLNACTEVMREWSQPPEERANDVVTCSEMMERPSHRLDVKRLASSKNETKLREAMRQPTHDAATLIIGLLEAYESGEATDAIDSQERMRAMSKAAIDAEETWRCALVSSTLRITGAVKIGVRPPGKNQSDEYSSALEEVEVLKQRIKWVRTGSEKRGLGNGATGLR